MNISLPDSLKDFVDEQVNERGYGTSSEYVRELIRKDKDRLRLRSLLLAGTPRPTIHPRSMPETTSVYRHLLGGGVSTAVYFSPVSSPSK